MWRPRSRSVGAQIKCVSFLFNIRVKKLLWRALDAQRKPISIDPSAPFVQVVASFFRWPAWRNLQCFFQLKCVGLFSRSADIVSLWLLGRLLRLDVLVVAAAVQPSRRLAFWLTKKHVGRSVFAILPLPSSYRATAKKKIYCPVEFCFVRSQTRKKTTFRTFFSRFRFVQECVCFT